MPVTFHHIAHANHKHLFGRHISARHHSVSKSNSFTICYNMRICPYCTIFQRQLWGMADWANHSTCHKVGFECFKGKDTDLVMGVLGATLASLNTFLSVACAFLYLTMCIRLNRQFSVAENVSTMHSQGIRELTKLKWRLTLIVLITTVCWIPVTTIHWYTMFSGSSALGRALFEDLTAANLILVSISPAVNPLIYTIAISKQMLEIPELSGYNSSSKRTGV